MKVVAFNGSARRDGNTAMLIKYVFEELEAGGVETEMFQMAGRTIRGCTGCRKCAENRNKRCVMEDDILNGCVELMDGADGVILASPVYFTDVTAEMKALIDRAGIVCRANDYMLKRKAGAAVVAVRRAGAMHTFDSLNHFFQIQQMIIPGSSYWNVGIGRDPGDVANDAEGVATMRDLGRNMAWLLDRIRKE